MRNIFELPAALPADGELLEPLLSTGAVLIERIISRGDRTPEGQWLQQVRDEWVILLQGEAVLSWIDGTRRRMTRGDWLFIPSGQQHRVEKTSVTPACIWLAVHASMQQA
jgi:cupin 2 domain-containing protein